MTTTVDGSIDFNESFSINNVWPFMPAIINLEEQVKRLTVEEHLRPPMNPIR